MAGRALREVFAEFTIVFDRQRQLLRGNRTVRQLERRVESSANAVRSLSNNMQRAVSNVRPGFQRISEPFERLNHQLDRAPRKVERTSRSMNRFSGVLETLRGRLGAASLAIGGLAGVYGIGRLGSAIVENTEQLTRWSNRLGVSVRELRQWQGIAAQFGADLDDVTDAFKELQLKANDAVTGGTAQAEMFQRIGISLDDLRPIVDDSSAVMDLFVTRLNEVNDAGLRNFTVDELMSDAGTRMLPVFNLGAEAIARMREESEAGARATEELARAQAPLMMKLRGAAFDLETIATQIFVRLIPALEWIVEKGEAVVKVISDMVTNSHMLESALIVLTGVLFGVAVAQIAAWGPTGLAIAAVAAAVVGLTLLVEDLWTTMEGGDSVTRRLLDSLFGIGFTNRYITMVRDAIGDLTAYIRVLRVESAIAWANFRQQVQPVVNVVNSVVSSVTQLINQLGIARDAASALSGAWRAVSGAAQRISPLEPLRRMGEIGEQERVRQARATRRTREREAQAIVANVQNITAGTAATALTRHVPGARGDRLRQEIQQTLTFNISERTDAQEVQRMVRDGVNEANQASARQLQAGLARNPT